MIQTISELYSILRSSPEEIKYLLGDIHSQYIPGVEPKRKYGDIQLDKHGNVRLRQLMKPSEKIKRTQQRINNYLQQIILPVYMNGSVPGRNHIINAKQHLNQKYFLTIDLKNFFPNINHQQVFQLFRRYNFSPEVSRVLTKLTTYQNGLPQGAPSSPVIANLVFLPVAYQLHAIAKNANLQFTCYLDDLSFSSQKPFKHLIPDILNIIRSNGFFPSHNKIHYCMDKCEITGLVVYKNTLNVIHEMRRAARKKPNLKVYVQSIDNLHLD